MTNLIALATELLGLLKPHISPSEYDRRLKELLAIEDKNEKLRAKIREALASGDVDALNVLLGSVFGDLM